MEIPNLSNIPMYLEATTKQALIELMWGNNALNGRAYNYMSPIKEGSKWVVWFYGDIENWKMPKKSDAIQNVEVK